MKPINLMVKIALCSMLTQTVIGAESTDWERCREGGSSPATCLLILRVDGSIHSLAVWSEAYEAGVKAAQAEQASREELDAARRIYEENARFNEEVRRRVSGEAVADEEERRKRIVADYLSTLRAEREKAARASPAPQSKKWVVVSEVLRRLGNGARSYSNYMNAVRAQGFAHQYQSLPNLPLSGTAQRLGNSTFYSFSNGMQCIATQLGATVFYNCNQ
jgi:hypothetical protein